MKKFLTAIMAASFIMTSGVSFGAGEQQAPAPGPQPAMQQGTEQLSPVPAQAPAKKATKKRAKKAKKAKVKKAKAKKAKAKKAKVKKATVKK